MAVSEISPLAPDSPPSSGIGPPITASSLRSPRRASPTRSVPLGAVAVEPKVNEKGEREIWPDERTLNEFAALRGPGESYSDVIVGLAAAES
jgi:hypothetical protein